MEPLQTSFSSVIFGRKEKVSKGKGRARNGGLLRNEAWESTGAQLGGGAPPAAVAGGGSQLHLGSGEGGGREPTRASSGSGEGVGYDPGEAQQTAAGVGLTWHVPTGRIKPTAAELGGGAEFSPQKGTGSKKKGFDVLGLLFHGTTSQNQRGGLSKGAADLRRKRESGKRAPYACTCSSSPPSPP